MKKIFLRTLEEIEENLKIFPYSEAHKNNICCEYKCFLKFLKERNYIEEKDSVVMLEKTKIDEVVRMYIDTKKSVSHKNLTRVSLKVIFMLNNLNFDREKYPVNEYEKYVENEDKILTLEEFKEEIKNIFNDSEKLLAYMAYQNILGSGVKNARFAKVKDVNFENKTWKLYDGRIIELEDEFLVKLLKNAIKQMEYIPYDKKEKLSGVGMHFPNSYPYNPNCEYIFKTRMHPRSDNGLAPFSEIGIIQIFKRMVEEFGHVFGRNNLKKSGVVEKMYKYNPNPNWTIKQVEKFKKERKISISAISIRIAFFAKYFPNEMDKIKNRTKKDIKKEKLEKVM